MTCPKTDLTWEEWLGARKVRRATCERLAVVVPMSPDLQRKLIAVLVEAQVEGASAEQVTAAFRRARGTVFAESVGNYVLDQTYVQR